MFLLSFYVFLVSVTAAVIAFCISQSLCSEPSPCRPVVCAGNFKIGWRGTSQIKQLRKCLHSATTAVVLSLCCCLHIFNLCVLSLSLSLLCGVSSYGTMLVPSKHDLWSLQMEPVVSGLSAWAERLARLWRLDGESWGFPTWLRERSVWRLLVFWFSRRFWVTSTRLLACSTLMLSHFNQNWTL
jgi:hypothetical protein